MLLVRFFFFVRLLLASIFIRRWPAFCRQPSRMPAPFGGTVSCMQQCTHHSIDVPCPFIAHRHGQVKKLHERDRQRACTYHRNEINYGQRNVCSYGIMRTWISSAICLHVLDIGRRATNVMNLCKKKKRKKCVTE